MLWATRKKSTVGTNLGAVTQLLATPRDAEGVGAVLDNGETVLVADLVQALHVTHLRSMRWPNSNAIRYTAAMPRRGLRQASSMTPGEVVPGFGRMHLLPSDRIESVSVYCALVAGPSSKALPKYGSVHFDPQLLYVSR